MTLKSSKLFPQLPHANGVDIDRVSMVDGNPVTVRRCNYLCQGVFVEQGNHEVILKYAPDCKWLWVQGFGMLVCVTAIGILVVGRYRTSNRSIVV